MEWWIQRKYFSNNNSQKRHVFEIKKIHSMNTRKYAF